MFSGSLITHINALEDEAEHLLVP